MARIVIVNPRFTDSFWGLENTAGMVGKRANLPVSCLALLGALVPDHHDVTLLDENVEDIDFDRLGQADLVCLTGMNIQCNRMFEILKEVRSRGVFTVVGGAMATVDTDKFDGLVDVIFVGEADETWPQFLREWEEGCHANRYQQTQKSDLTKLPLPRIDLLKAQHYMFGSMQITRGCPFTCEFCDIIITFGRKPRLKTSEQVLAELESFVRAGLSIIFVVDDNLIGNRKAIKPIIRDIIRWQEERAYPLALFTEASLDLAEDEELMELMGQANFQSVFIGIESPNEASLVETKKLQNVRPKAGTILERVHRIHQHGLEVWCGMILGFDNDNPSVFDAMPQFLKDARIGNALIGLLFAIPTTPLYDRIKKEGRLNNEADTQTYGTNIVPLSMGREELQEGFIKVMAEVYHVDAYFERVDSLFIRDRFKFTGHELPYWRKHRWTWARKRASRFVGFLYIVIKLMQYVPEPELRARYRKQLWKVLRARTFEPHVLFGYALKVAMHYHFSCLSKAMARDWEENRKVPMDRVA